MQGLIDGRYSAMQHLGGGGFGNVYLAFDTHSNRKVAVKFLATAMQDAAERMYREARILASRQTEHIVELIDANFNHAPPYIVMEFCDGGSLRAWVGTNPPWQNVAAALSHALVGLAELHRQGGFHRDIKPDNLLVASHPQEPGMVIVKLADLGLARIPATENPPMTRRAAGTEGYLAPELRQDAPFTQAADIYSLGVTGVELLTNSRSAAGLSAAWIPPGLRSLLQAMLSPTPAGRPNASQVANTLSMLLNPSQVQPQQFPQAQAGSGSDAGGIILGGLLVAGVFAALIALAGGKK